MRLFLKVFASSVATLLVGVRASGQPALQRTGSCAIFLQLKICFQQLVNLEAQWLPRLDWLKTKPRPAARHLRHEAAACSRPHCHGTHISASRPSDIESRESGTAVYSN